MALIDLGKETQAEAVAHAWDQVLELPDQSRQTLPPNKKMSHIFDEMNRALLILGEPGSGKTITLLQLAQDLIAQCEADQTFVQPVPVVFNLSSWIDKRQPLIDWMVGELITKYQIPKRIGRSWLENNRLLPLLDGLDEVRVKNQAACVEEINKFGAEFGLTGLVVCSRLKEYTSLPVRLKLNGAIRLQPLTLEQVYDYLNVAGSKLDALRRALQTDKNLQDMARSPLILGIMSLAYQDMPVKILAGQMHNMIETRYKHLFDTYIERMLSRKGTGNHPYSDEQTKEWLIWLAQQMSHHQQTIFLIERMQPSWLSDQVWKWLYVFGSRLIGGAIILSLSLSWWGGALWVNSAAQILTIIAALLTIGFIDIWRIKQADENPSLQSHHNYWHKTLRVLSTSLMIGLVSTFVWFYNCYRGRRGNVREINDTGGHYSLRFYLYLIQWRFTVGPIFWFARGANRNR